MRRRYIYNGSTAQSLTRDQEEEEYTTSTTPVNEQVFAEIEMPDRNTRKSMFPGLDREEISLK